jgi:hypothetical protein
VQSKNICLIRSSLYILVSLASLFQCIVCCMMQFNITTVHHTWHNSLSSRLYPVRIGRRCFFLISLRTKTNRVHWFCQICSPRFVSKDMHLIGQLSYDTNMFFPCDSNSSLVTSSNALLTCDIGTKVIKKSMPKVRSNDVFFFSCVYNLNY